MKKIIVALLLMTSISYGQPLKVYSPEDLKSDLVFLKLQLENKHPNLYLYSDKKQIESAFDSIASNIKQAMFELDFYKQLSLISSIIKDGHTVILPSEGTRAYHNANSKFLPYKLRLCNNSLFVEQVLRDDMRLVEKTEITAINGVNSQEIIAQLTARLPRDGYNQSYPNWIIDHYFKEYYAFIFGHPQQFVIQYKINEHSTIDTMQALSKQQINYFQQQKYFQQSAMPKPHEGITYEAFPAHNYACLTIKDFHHEVLTKEYKQNFKTEIKNAFEKLRAASIENLILDLRNNQGGSIKYGAFLLSYLINKDFRVLEHYYKVANSSGQLCSTAGEAQGIYKPKDLCFKGRLFVLINGGSFSNSGIVASALRSQTNAIFVGQETGGNNKVLAGYIHKCILPNTKITVEIPTKQYLLNEQLALSGQGTMPDYEINPTMDNIILKQDSQKEFILKLILEKKSAR